MSGIKLYLYQKLLPLIETSDSIHHMWKRTGATYSAIYQRLKEMEKMKWITLNKSGRKVIPKLTETGKKVADACWVLHVEISKVKE